MASPFSTRARRRSHNKEDSHAFLSAELQRARLRQRLQSPTYWMACLIPLLTTVTFVRFYANEQHQGGHMASLSSVLHWEEAERQVSWVRRLLHHPILYVSRPLPTAATTTTPEGNRMIVFPPPPVAPHPSMAPLTVPIDTIAVNASQMASYPMNNTTAMNASQMVYPVSLQPTVLPPINDSSNNNNNNIHVNSNPNEGMQYVNPSLFGWTPEQYPNPLVAPIRCGIAYLSMYNNMSSSPTATMPPPNLWEHYPPHVRLCDPDWVLGGWYLQAIALALRNFTDQVGDAWHGYLITPPPSIPAEDDPSWTGTTATASNRTVLRGHGSYYTSHTLHHSDHAKNHTHTAIDSNNNINHNDDDDDPLDHDAHDLSVWLEPSLSMAVATVRKMNLPAVLRDGSYYAYEDEEDMVNDAAQIFARHLHETWWASDPDDPSGQLGIVLFLSVQDRVCFISTGGTISMILPWWRLDHVVAQMKPHLRQREYGLAILQALDALTVLLQEGPPTWSDRLHDFMARFGVVLAFACMTFLFGVYGEYRDRRKRWQYAEQRSQLTDADRQKASLLQLEYKTKSCPICLEHFDGECEEMGDSDEEYEDTLGKPVSTKSLESPCPSLRRVDTYGVPLKGADGKRIKLLRCGHVFCESCWKSWVHSGCGNPCNCPVCRQDVGQTPRKRKHSTSDGAYAVAAALHGTSVANYDSFSSALSPPPNEEDENDSDDDEDSQSAEQVWEDLNTGLPSTPNERFPLLSTVRHRHSV
jgi:hypothetical protein